MKQEKDSAWVEAVLDLCAEIKKFLVENARALYMWN